MSAIVAFLTDSALGGNGPSSASVTHMMALAHTGEAVSAFSSSTPNDPVYETPIGVAGTFSNYQMNLVANSRTTTTTFGLAKAGVAGNSSVSFNGSAVGVKRDSTDSDIVAVADDWSQYWTTGSGTGNPNGGMSCQFRAVNGTAFLLGAVGTGTSFSGTSVNRFQGIGAVLSGSNVATTEAPAQALCTVGGAVSYFHSGIISNARTASQTHNLRNNGGNAGPTVSFAASAVGLHIDSISTATFAVNDLPCTEIVLGSDSGVVTWNLTGFTYVSAVDGAVWSPSVKAGGVASSTVGYSPPLGNFSFNAAQSTSAIQTGLPTSTWKNMIVRVSANSSGTTTTYTFNVNNSDVTQTVSFNAAATGRKQDSLHSDVVGQTDTLTIHRTGLNASVTENEIGFEYDVPILPVAVINAARQAVNRAATY